MLRLTNYAVSMAETFENHKVQFNFVLCRCRFARTAKTRSDDERVVGMLKASELPMKALTVYTIIAPAALR